MAVLPRFLIISVVVAGNWFRAVEGMKFPRAAAAPQEDQSSIDVFTPMKIFIGPEVTKLDSNALSNVTRHMSVRIRNPSQFKIMKCDVFGGEKSLPEKDQLQGEPKVACDLRDFRLPELVLSRTLETIDVWPVAYGCIVDGTLVTVKLLEPGRKQEDVNCQRLDSWDRYIDLKGKHVIKIDKGWCCSGMANASDYLAGSTIRWEELTLRLESTGIREISAGAFENGLLLRHAYLSHNNFTDTKIVTNLTSTLHKLVLAHNHITEIKANTFGHLTEINDLDLSNNLIETLEPSAFRNHYRLKKLDLRKNRISNLAAGVFAGLPVMQYVNMDFNLLTTIPARVLNFPQLGVLGLADNKIAIIESGAFKNVGHCRTGSHRTSFYLDVSRNPIKILQNGALFGLPKSRDCAITMEDTPVEIIEGGLFDE